jgi:predicted metal-dependent phosphoesterase TrpH
LQSFKVTVAEVIDVIHQGGGVAVWAHPGEKQLRRRLEEMVSLGLDGVEVRNFRRDSSAITKVHADARKYGLLTTGGSDWHEGPGFGEDFVTEELLNGFLGRMGLPDPVRP